MMTKKWIITHMMNEGGKSWLVDQEKASEITEFFRTADVSSAHAAFLQISTTTGSALIWLTPGQSLTIEEEP